MTHEKSPEHLHGFEPIRTLICFWLILASPAPLRLQIWVSYAPPCTVHPERYAICSLYAVHRVVLLSSGIDVCSVCVCTCGILCQQQQQQQPVISEPQYPYAVERAQQACTR